MHDLPTIYEKIKSTLKSVGKEYFVFGENTKFYPNRPKMSDLEIVSLALCAEALQIDSESLLWSKIKTDYPALFSELPHRTRFNSRRKALKDLTGNLLFELSELLKTENEYLIIDSMPIETCRLVRERNSKACRRIDKDEILATKGYNSATKRYFIGYKLHLIITSSGVFKDMLITKASSHDSCFLKELNMDDQHLNGYVLLGDRAYLGKGTQLRLFEEINLDLKVPYRSNQKDFKEYPKEMRVIRKKIETVFSQFCDEFLIRRNYAKRYLGFETRLLTKVISKTFKQYWNFLNGNPINKTKHSLAA